jgi:hypothetical protein
MPRCKEKAHYDYHIFDGNMDEMLKFLAKVWSTSVELIQVDREPEGSQVLQQVFLRINFCICDDKQSPSYGDLVYFYSDYYYVNVNGGIYTLPKEMFDAIYEEVN